MQFMISRSTSNKYITQVVDGDTIQDIVNKVSALFGMSFDKYSHSLVTLIVQNVHELVVLKQIN